MDYYNKMKIETQEKKRHFFILVDGEIMAYYEKDQHFPDGFYSYIKIRFTEDDYFSTELRRSSSAINVFVREILDRVKSKGHFYFGNFDSKKYIK